LHLDADEVLERDGGVEVGASSVRSGAACGYLLRRIELLMGRPVRFSARTRGIFGSFRSGHGACENRLYDQHFVADAPRRHGCAAACTTRTG